MAVTVTDYAADVAKFTGSVNQAAVKEIVDYCGIALHDRDSAAVSASDPEELGRIRVGFAAKKLGLAPEAAGAGIEAVVAKMKDVHYKHRVTFYYLLAEQTGTLDKLIQK